MAHDDPFSRALSAPDAPPALQAWHAYMDSGGDRDRLDALIDDDCVFVSPVVHTPQAGKALTMAYLLAAARVLGGPAFHYVGYWRAPGSAVLEFETEREGIRINGVDMIDWNADGRITRFRVMVRPLKAMETLRGLMAAELAAMARP